ncbi:MAG: YicC family protein [Firmicutes bacterium]|nr:YicC family protein [Bacillota bacterium]
MIKSMTGYGRAQQTIGEYEVMVEIKSLNHRYLDFNIKTSRRYAFLEDAVKSCLKGFISRGKVEVILSVRKQFDDSKSVLLNSSLAKGYIDALTELSTKFGIKNDLSTSVLARFDDIFDTSYQEQDEKESAAAALSVVEAAASGFTQMRRREGEKLYADMSERNGYIRNRLKEIEKLEPQTVNDYREKLEQKIKELLAGAPVDEGRILAETAIFADKVSITEEIVRLHSHIGEFERIASADEPVGRKLDFLLQEMNREINTIGSKSNSLDISKIVVDIKAELEKIREQLQNVE